MSLLEAAKALRVAQRAYMAARAERGGQDRAYDDTLNQLGQAVALAANALDAAIAVCERDGVWEGESRQGPTVDFTNHHNAARCPYCNPYLDTPAPASEGQ